MLDDLARLGAALVAGALIGLERELHDKPAGFRTNILICVGAALFAIVSHRMAGGPDDDSTRIAAQVVSGIGFLGAGAIIQHRGSVHGLTTAATIWVVASIGLAFGAGQWISGTLGTLVTGLVLFGLTYAEAFIDRWRSAGIFEIRIDDGDEGLDRVNLIVAESGLRRDFWALTRKDNILIVEAKLVGPGRVIRSVQERLARAHGVRSLQRR